MENVNYLNSPIEKSYRELKKGDVMKTSDSGEIVFDEWSRGMGSFKFTQLSTGKRYKRMIRTDIFSMKWTVIGTVEIKTASDTFGNDAKDLTKGDLFILADRKKSCEAFRFVEYGRSGKINACSPIDETMKWTIPTSMTCIKIENLK